MVSWLAAEKCEAACHVGRVDGLTSGSSEVRSRSCILMEPFLGIGDYQIRQACVSGSACNKQRGVVCPKRAYAALSIYYRCADGRFLMLPRGVAVSSHRYISSSETMVSAVIRG